MHSPRRFLLTSLAALILLLAAAAPAQADTQTHVVQPGETLFRIALKYGVTVEALQAANGVYGTTIYAGQVLTIPDLNAPLSVAPANSGAASATHVVQRGETLFTIGLKYNLQWTAIQAANGLQGTTVYAGQKLVIPGRAGTTTSTTPVSAPTEDTASQPDQSAPPPAPAQTPSRTHVVQRGETLFLIGLKYNLPWTAIQTANGLQGTTVYAGQTLVIPGGATVEALRGLQGAASAETINPPAPPPAGDSGQKRFLVDLSEQRLYAYEGDTLVRTTLISSGLSRYPTVTGTFYIYLRYTSARMRGPGYDLPNVPYVMYFYKSYGLHGTYWHNNFGTPMSHGCVNMPTSEAEWAYNWSTYGTPVIVQP